MKLTLLTSLLAVALVSPSVTFAQSSLTRAQVHAQLVEFKVATRNVVTSDAHYPDAALYAVSHSAAGEAHTVQGYGGVTDGASASGARVVGAQDVRNTEEIPGLKPVYFGQ